MNPFTTDTATYTRLMLTETLKKALSDGGFDVAYGGGRRDERRPAPRSAFSRCAAGPSLGPKEPAPEPWRVFQFAEEAGPSFRVFPLSNWTEADIWAYIDQEQVPIVRSISLLPAPW